MLTLHTKLDHADTIDDTLVLDFDRREKCRLRVRLASGEEAALFMVRGTRLRDGDLLTGPENKVVRVTAALEPTYAIRCPDPLTLVRCAYHLGNRHTPVAIMADGLRIRADTVLRDMVEGLGGQVTDEDAPFEPEQGAYSGGGHHHGEQLLLAPVPLRQKIHRPGDIDRA
ncbi:MAG: urease accessory protein UreE [Pseudomonadota bacterium]|nr:urease accessory protein UreE [Pseudomonadota bacterium]